MASDFRQRLLLLNDAARVSQEAERRDASYFYDQWYEYAHPAILEVFNGAIEVLFGKGLTKRDDWRTTLSVRIPKGYYELEFFPHFPSRRVHVTFRTPDGTETSEVTIDRITKERVEELVECLLGRAFPQ